MICFGVPAEDGSRRVKTGASMSREDDELHLTGEGISGGEGSVAGANTEKVALAIVGCNPGGIKTCRVSPLEYWHKNHTVNGKIDTYVPATKNATSFLGHHSIAVTLPPIRHVLTTFPTSTSHNLISPRSSPLTIHSPPGLTLTARTRDG